jgi:hypothetical protein
MACRTRIRARGWNALGAGPGSLSGYIPVISKAQSSLRPQQRPSVTINNLAADAHTRKKYMTTSQELLSAWNPWLSNLCTHEFAGLEAAEPTNTILETVDPRIFDVEHWYTECGDNFNALRVHKAVHQE